LLTSWLILFAFIVATIDTKKCGFFTQERVGERGQIFKVIKIRSMRDISGINTMVTTAKDPRITKVGRFLRKSKLDELPQLINIILGQMSFVGPRPDVDEVIDALPEKDRERLLSVKPGITGPATLKYRDEEKILAQADDPEAYNLEIILKDKAIINKEYVDNYSLKKDLQYIIQTVLKTG